MAPLAWSGAEHSACTDGTHGRSPEQAGSMGGPLSRPAPCAIQVRFCEQPGTESRLVGADCVWFLFRVVERWDQIMLPSSGHTRTAELCTFSQ